MNKPTKKPIKQSLELPQQQPVGPINAQTFAHLLTHIQHSCQQVFAPVNTALIALYWSVGQGENNE
jgi:hypothetical protein